MTKIWIVHLRSSFIITFLTNAQLSIKQVIIINGSSFLAFQLMISHSQSIVYLVLWRAEMSGPDKNNLNNRKKAALLWATFHWHNCLNKLVFGQASASMIYRLTVRNYCTRMQEWGDVVCFLNVINIIHSDSFIYFRYHSLSPAFITQI